MLELSDNQYYMVSFVITVCDPIKLEKKTFYVAERGDETF